MVCQEKHRYDIGFTNLPEDQGRDGRHKCSGCAYERGFHAGLNLEENVSLDLTTLPDSQAGTVRHKSPHAAFAKGYLDGVYNYYKN